MNQKKGVIKQNKNNDEADRLDFLLNEIKEDINSQYEGLQSYKTKASALLGFAAIVLSILIYQKQFLDGLIFSLITLLILASILLATYIAFVPKYSFLLSPNPDDLKKKFLECNLKESKDWLLNELIKYYKGNGEIVEMEQSILLGSVISFIIALFLLGLRILFP